MKNRYAQRTAALALAAALVLSGSASALFGKKTEKTAEPGAPAAQDLEIKTYRGVPYQAKFLAVDKEGEAVTFALEDMPKKGTVVIADDSFTYAPDEGTTGSDKFTYTATDSAGHTSLPATVTVTIEKTKSGVDYKDMEGSAAAAAAQEQAETRVLTRGRNG